MTDKLLKFLVPFLLFFSTTSGLFSQTAQQIDELRTIVTLLDYVSKDYGFAVENGEIIDEAEYEEQIDFVEKSLSLHKDLTPVFNNEAFTKLESNIEVLLEAIHTFKDPNIVSELALASKNAILDLGILKISPTKWPSLENGRVLYEKSCASCHGPKGFGDGAQGKNLDPSPTSFMEEDDMNVLSPLQAYNVIKLGVEGTGMASYDKLFTESEIWDLAFFVKSMIHEGKGSVSELPKDISLDSITKWNDSDLIKFLASYQGNATIQDIRTYEPVREAPTDIAMKELIKSYEVYKTGDLRTAESHALKSYLEGIELVESLLPREKVAVIEKDMIAYRKAIKANDSERVEKYFNKLKEGIEDAEDYIDGVDYSFAFVFGAALSILIREALEALLIILIVLSILKPLNIKRAVFAVHLGWIVAVILGFVSWIFVDKLVNLSGASREVMEGIGSLIAVLVLLYAGTWLHSHSEVSKWTAFVKEKVNKVSQSGNWIGLSVFSFIVVFREAFEVVLFLSSINLSENNESSSALLWALVTSVVIIAIIAYIFTKTTKRLPISQIFKFSAIVIALLAIVLTGKGIHALQEAGYIPFTYIEFLPQFDLFGIYPYLQTILAQLAVLAFIVLFSRWNKRKQVKKGE